MHALFVIVYSPDQQSFYFHSLMWLVQISEEKDFEDKWLNVEGMEDLRSVILSSWEKLKIEQNFME